MKGFIGSLLLGSCICSCTTKLHAQSAEFAPIGATWWYDQVEMFPPYNIALNKFEVIGDTIIAGLDLRVLKYDFIRNNGTGYTYNYFINNDSGKISIYNIDTDSLQPYFNFNASVGDTLVTTCPYDAPAYSVVDSIVNVVVNGIDLKRFYITPAELLYSHNNFPDGAPYNYFTERIGNNYYFFPIPGAADPPPGGHLRCYEDNILGLVGNDEIAECEYLSPVTDFENGVFELSPNPSNGIFEVGISSDENYKFVLIDINGRFIPLNATALGPTIFQFNITSLPSGCYTIIAIDKNQFVGSKVLIKL